MPCILQVSIPVFVGLFYPVQKNYMYMFECSYTSIYRTCDGKGAYAYTHVPQVYKSWSLYTEFLRNLSV